MTQIWHKSYDSDVPPEIELRDLTLGDALAETVERFPDRIALSFLNMKLTYAELLEETDRLATALAQLGAGKNSKIAIQMPNSPQTMIAFYATQRLGAQAVMTNPLYVPREIEHQWNDAGCEFAVVADFLFDQKIRQIRDKLPVREYVIASIPEYLRFPLKQLAPLKLKRAEPPLVAKVSRGPGIHFFRELIGKTERALPEVHISMDDVAVLQYTGGTTGVSKGAMLTHGNLSYNTQQIWSWFTGLAAGQEVILGALPMFHIFGITCVACLGSFCGAEMAMVANPRDIPMLVKTSEKRRVTIFFGVPAMYQAINQFKGIENRDLNAIRYCFSGSAPMPIEVQKEFERLTGAVILEGYGLTETSPVATVNPLKGQRKIGSIGLPVPNTGFRIVDDDGNDVPTGEAGEILLRGPQVFPGYWKRESERAESFNEEGWFRTGDLGTMDSEGYARIVGRKKDMILASGYNIYPDEIDQVLSTHPAVHESCTIGVPDPKRGETVKAFVVLHEAGSASADDLIAHCRENLAAYKVPRFVEFRDELPRSSVLKLLRRVLKEEELNRIQGQNKTDG